MLVNDVGRLRDLVEELMELSRFDADAEEVGARAGRPRQADRDRARGALTPATFQAPAKPVVIDADPRRLERILGNFLDNAREHAGDKGVEIELDAARPDEIVIAVSDRGPGVPRGSPRA